MQGSAGSSSVKAQLESVWRQTGVKPKELEALVELPEDYQYLWEYFISLHNARSYGMSMNPITYGDIDAYFRLMKVEPYVWEVQTIKVMDSIAMQAISKEQQRNSKSKKK